MFSKIGLVALLLLGFSGFASERISHEEIQDSKLKALSQAFFDAELFATDQSRSSYKYSKAPDGSDIADLFEDPYIEGYEINVEGGSRNGPVFEAHKMARYLFTADPYQPEYSFVGIENVEAVLVDLLTAGDSYTVYSVQAWGPFHSSSYSIIVTSDSSNELIELSAGYSE
ncbi:MAG: hypothetical protein AAF202_05750 [Pseudomonadota bacterium]